MATPSSAFTKVAIIVIMRKFFIIDNVLFRVDQFATPKAAWRQSGILTIATPVHFILCILPFRCLLIYLSLHDNLCM